MQIDIDPNRMLRSVARRWRPLLFLAFCLGVLFALWGVGHALLTLLPWSAAELFEGALWAAETLARAAWGAAVLVFLATVLIWFPGVSRLVVGNLRWARGIRKRLEAGAVVPPEEVELAGRIFLSSAIRLAAFLLSMTLFGLLL